MPIFGIVVVLISCEWAKRHIVSTETLTLINAAVAGAPPIVGLALCRVADRRKLPQLQDLCAQLDAVLATVPYKNLTWPPDRAAIKSDGMSETLRDDFEAGR